MSRFDARDFYIQSNWLHSPPPEGKLLKVAAMDGLDSERWGIHPAELEQLVCERLEMFDSHIDGFYQDTLRKNAGRGLTIGRPSIWLAQLGTVAQSETRWNDVFTEKGYNNSGIIKDIDELKEPYHPYWQAIIEGSQSRMLPEVRRVSGRALGGAWLRLELDESKIENSIDEAE